MIRPRDDTETMSYDLVTPRRYAVSTWGVNGRTSRNQRTQKLVCEDIRKIIKHKRVERLFFSAIKRIIDLYKKNKGEFTSGFT